MTVLIVEDDASIASTLELTLHSEGYATVVAENGTRALEVLRQIKVDLLITDLNMPPLSGRQLIEAKLADPHLRGLPTIVVSGEKDIHLIAGVQATIAKPFSVDELLDAVSGILHGA